MARPPRGPRSQQKGSSRSRCGSSPQGSGSGGARRNHALTFQERGLVVERGRRRVVVVVRVKILICFQPCDVTCSIRSCAYTHTANYSYYPYYTAHTHKHTHTHPPTQPLPKVSTNIDARFSTPPPSSASSLSVVG